MLHIPPKISPVFTRIGHPTFQVQPPNASVIKSNDFNAGGARRQLIDHMSNGKRNAYAQQNDAQTSTITPILCRIVTSATDNKYNPLAPAAAAAAAA
jgi:hypothetical protein